MDAEAAGMTCSKGFPAGSKGTFKPIFAARALASSSQWLSHVIGLVTSDCNHGTGLLTAAEA